MRLKAAVELDRQGKPYTSLPLANPRGGKRVKKGTSCLVRTISRRYPELSVSRPPLQPQRYDAAMVRIHTFHMLSTCTQRRRAVFERWW